MKRIIFAVMITLAFRASAPAFETKCGKCEFYHSDSLGADIGYRIFLPPGYDKDAEKRYPVVYLLHGYNFARNSTEKEAPMEGVNHWMDQENLPEIAGCLMTESTADAADKCISGKGVATPNDVVKFLLAEYPDIKLPIPPMIVVAPDGRNSWYVDRVDGKGLYPPDDGPDFTNGLFKGATGQFESYIVKDLVQYIDKHYKTLTDRGHRGIGGFSMGGIGSMNIALKHSDIFSSVTSESASYNLAERFTNTFDFQYVKDTVPELLSVMVPADAESKPGSRKYDIAQVRKYDSYTIAKNMDKIDLHIYFDAGEKDFFSGKNNFDTFTKFDALLKTKGIVSSPAVHVIAGDAGNGSGLHTSRFWRSRLGVLLEFHARAMGLR